MPAAVAPAGVWTSLAELVALQALAHAGGISARQPPRSVLAGRRASRLRGRGLAFEEMREYRHGDDVRCIDWRVTARTGRTHLRLYAEERERPVLLVVDQRLGMFFGTRMQMKSVTAAELAALLAWQSLAAGDRVGAVVFNDGETVEIDPQRSRGNVLRVLDGLVHFNGQLGLARPPKPDAGRLDQVLAGVARRAATNWLVVVVSDFHGIGEATRRHVRLIARHNDVVAAFVHDPVANDLPFGGRCVLSDGIVQADIDLGDAATRAVIGGTKTARDDFLAQLRRELDVPCLAIDTRGQVPRQLATALGQSAARVAA